MFQYRLQPACISLCQPLPSNPVEDSRHWQNSAFPLWASVKRFFSLLYPPALHQPLQSRPEVLGFAQFVPPAAFIHAQRLNRIRKIMQDQALWPPACWINFIQLHHGQWFIGSLKTSLESKFTSIKLPQDKLLSQNWDLTTVWLQGKQVKCYAQVFWKFLQTWNCSILCETEILLGKWSSGWVQHLWDS